MTLEIGPEQVFLGAVAFDTIGRRALSLTQRREFPYSLSSASDDRCSDFLSPLSIPHRQRVSKKSNHRLECKSGCRKVT